MPVNAPCNDYVEYEARAKVGGSGVGWSWTSRIGDTPRKQSAGKRERRPRPRAGKGKRDNDKRMATSGDKGTDPRPRYKRSRLFSLLVIESQGPEYIQGPFEAVENCGLRWAMRVTRLPDGVGFRPWDPLQFRFRGGGGDPSPTKCASPVYRHSEAGEWSVHHPIKDSRRGCHLCKMTRASS